MAVVSVPSDGAVFLAWRWFRCHLMAQFFSHGGGFGAI
jgi:hypothetical protein